MNSTLKLIFFTLIFFILNNVDAQRKWDAGGDKTSWNDALNWAGDTIPLATEIAEIAKDATITGTVAAPPIQLKISGKAKVTLNLNLKIGTTSSEQHAITIGPKCNVVLGSDDTPYTIELFTSATKNGISNTLSGDSTNIRVAAKTTLQLNNHVNGFNLLAPHSTFKNDGKMEFAATVKNGIKSLCKFSNAGSIVFNNVITDGINLVGGTFTNEETATIELKKSGDDGIEVIGEATFINKGTINGTNADAATPAKNVIAVGSTDTLGTFINEVSGKLNLDGGVAAAARALSINDEGVFKNFGSINAAGGNPTSTIYSKANWTNEKNATITLASGRINLNKNGFTNNGLIVKTGGGPAITGADSTATITNNAFFKYDSTSMFAGGKAMLVENGIKLNPNNGRGKADAKGACNADLGQVSYDWNLDAVLYGVSDATGLLNFKAKSLAADSVILTTSFPNVSVKITNICKEAVKTTAVNEVNKTNLFKVYPSIVTNSDRLYIQSTTDVEINDLKLYDGQGRLLYNFNNSTSLQNLDLSVLKNGQYYISGSDGKNKSVAKIVKI